MSIKAAAAADDGMSRTDPTQFVHDSVLTRWDNDTTYRPPGLKDYFKSIGDRRGGEQ